jgi:hypothetical protein
MEVSIHESFFHGQQYIVRFARKQVRRDIRHKLGMIRSASYKQELMSKGWSSERSDRIAESMAVEFEQRLVEMKLPNSLEVSIAMAGSSREVKYVFGVLGFTAHAFVQLVNKFGFTTIEAIRNNRNNMDMIADLWISSECLWKLMSFICWFEDFVMVHDRLPQVIDIDFNENIWWHFYCYGTDVNGVRPRIFRGSTIPMMKNDINFLMYTEYVHYSELDLIRLGSS